MKLLVEEVDGCLVGSTASALLTGDHHPPKNGQAQPTSLIIPKVEANYRHGWK